MNKAQKFLLENNLGDIVLNAKHYPENTPENAKKWVYLSDVLEQYLTHNQALHIRDIVGQSEQYCGCKVKGAFDTETLHRCRKCDKEMI